MSLYTVSTGQTINAADVNQFTNVLQQPSGGQELGKYYLESGMYATNSFTSEYHRTTSQGATPVSVSIDTADQAATGINAPATAHLTSFGFQAKANGSSTNTDGRVGGNYTVQY